MIIVVVFLFKDVLRTVFNRDLARGDGFDVEGGPKCGQRCVPSVQRVRAGHEEGSVLRAAVGRRCTPVGPGGAETRCGTNPLDACLPEFPVDIE